MIAANLRATCATACNTACAAAFEAACGAARRATCVAAVALLGSACATAPAPEPIVGTGWHAGAAPVLGVRAAGSGPTARWSGDVFELSERADRAYREGRWMEAARHYGELTERVPADAYAWFRLGNTWARQGAFDRATHAYERSLERDAGQPKPWFNLSTAYLLNAQRAMNRSWAAMRPGDPGRAVIERRLAALATVIEGGTGEVQGRDDGLR